MEKIYIAHQSFAPFTQKILESWDLEKLYGFNITYSVESNEDLDGLKELIRKSDVVVTDLTNPTVKMGIEMALAEVFGIPICSFCLSGTAVPTYLKRMSNQFVEYAEEGQIEEELLRYLGKSKYSNLGFTNR